MPERPNGVGGREFVLCVGSGSLSVAATGDFGSLVKELERDREPDLLRRRLLSFAAAAPMKGSAPGTVPSVKPARELGALRGLGGTGTNGFSWRKAGC